MTVQCESVSTKNVFFFVFGVFVFCFLFFYTCGQGLKKKVKVSNCSGVSVLGSRA